MVQTGASPFLKLCRQVEGTAVLVQDGQALRLDEGDIVLYDTRRPYELIFEGPYVQQLVFIPSSRLRLQGGRLRAVLAQKHRTDCGVEHLLSELVREFDRRADQLTPGQRYAASVSMLTLLDSALESWTDGIPDTFSDLLAHIDARLHESNLGPASIAAANYMSVRALQGLFSRHSLTVSGYIRKRRLEMSRQDLQSPLLRDKTVTEIAHEWGFADGAHFSRLFKSTYGQNPSQVRSAPAETSPTRAKSQPVCARTQ